MVPVKDGGDGFDEEMERAFQYWPETVQLSRGDMGWQEKQIPGGSHAILQWTQCGSRRISFTTVFGRDVQDDPTGLLFPSGLHPDNVDVGAALAWLNYFCYPLYEQGDLRVKPPPTLMLVFPGSQMGTPQGKNEPKGAGGRGQNSSRGYDEMLCVLSSFDTTYQAWFPNGTVRLAEVSLEFIEVVQWPGGKILFHSRDQMKGAIERYSLHRIDWPDL